MYTLEALRFNIARIISEITETIVHADEITVPPKSEMGDFALVVSS